MKKSILRNYAALIVRMGVNVQKGQEVFISAELDQPEFVEMVVILAGTGLHVTPLGTRRLSRGDVIVIRHVEHGHIQR